MSVVINHPMDVNTNTRMRWEVMRRLPEVSSLQGLRVLDVGAGLGFFSVQFAKLGAEVLAVDLDADALCWLSSAWGIRTARVDAAVQDLPSGPFDLVFVGEVLEHMAEPREMLRRCARVLAPKGLLVVTTPALEGPLIHTKGKRLGHHDGTERHERDGFRFDELSGMLEGAGLTVRRHVFCIFLLAELFMQVTKAAYLRKGGSYRGQSDVVNQVGSAKYRLLRSIYPLLLAGFRIEQWVAQRLRLKGHCHVVVAGR